MYGKFINGKLVTCEIKLAGYKPIVYEKCPEYDELTQYAIQLPPVELEDCIYFGVEIRQLDLDDDENIDEGIENETDESDFENETEKENIPEESDDEESNDE